MQTTNCKQKHLNKRVLVEVFGIHSDVMLIGCPIRTGLFSRLGFGGLFLFGACAPFGRIKSGVLR